jgi:hypothetical protein
MDELLSTIQMRFAKASLFSKRACTKPSVKPRLRSSRRLLGSIVGFVLADMDGDGATLQVTEEWMRGWGEDMV